MIIRGKPTVKSDGESLEPKQGKKSKEVLQGQIGEG